MGNAPSGGNPGGIANYVIADASSSRKSVRSLLSDLGVKPSQIHVSESYGDAKDLILSQKPEVIFIGHEVAGTKLDEIAALQDQVLAPGSTRALFYITSNGSNSAASSAAEELADSVLVKPFTFEQLKEQVVTVIEEKFFPQPFQEMLNKGTGLLKTEKFIDALVCFKKAVELQPKLPLNHFYVGHALFKLGKPDESQKAFQQGLVINPIHFRCLLGMVELLSEIKKYDIAYAFAKKLAENHPIPIKKLPDFVKLSILNSQFNDVLEFYKLVDGMSDVDDILSSNLGAGLVVCGLFYLKDGKSREAVDIFKKAELIAKGNSKILTRMMVGLVKAKLDTEMNAFLGRMPKEVKDSIELQSALLETMRATDPMLALKTALNLISVKQFNPLIFRVAIEVSFDLKRKPATIEELIDQAIRTYPEGKADWERFRTQLATSVEAP